MIGIYVGLIVLAIGFIMFISGGIVNATSGDATQTYFDITAGIGSTAILILLGSGLYLWINSLISMC